MAKNERRRTMVYSNVHKKADSKSASQYKEKIDLDNEIVIGLEKPPKPNEKNKKSNQKGKGGQAPEKKKNRKTP